MFDLGDAELASNILGVGDGPASFNVEMHERGRRVISVDPIYVFSGDQIRARVEATHDQLVTACREHHDRFVWNHIRTPEEMGRVRLAAMERFLADYDAGRRDGRYLPAKLPELPFADGQFDLALCSHLLFLYSDHLSLSLHLAGITEMARVAREVRIFPLLMLGNTPSPHVGPVCEELRRRGYAVELRRVPYEFQKGGNEMMVVRRAR